jgi:membrane-associated phospholipid phosphatase
MAAALALRRLCPSLESMVGVYRVSLRAVAIGLGGLGALLVPYFAGRVLIRKHKPGRMAAINFFDRFTIRRRSRLAGALSIAGTVTAVAAPIAIDLVDVHGDLPALLEDMVVFGETMALNGVLNTAVKQLTLRPQPMVYVAPRSKLAHAPRGYRGFYSGHTSASWAALAVGCMTLRLRHGELLWPWLIAAALGSAIAAGRILAGKHFPTDVLVGALVGAGVGVAVPAWHAHCATKAKRPQG